MEDARVPELRPGVGVAGPAVEPGSVDLRVEVRRPESAPRGLALERRKQGRADPAATPSRQNRHPPDLHGRAVENVEPARPERNALVARQRVDGRRVGAIVSVDLFFRRHALLADEDFAPDREGQR